MRRRGRGVSYYVDNSASVLDCYLRRRHSWLAWPARRYSALAITFSSSKSPEPKARRLGLALVMVVQPDLRRQTPAVRECFWSLPSITGDRISSLYSQSEGSQNRCRLCQDPYIFTDWHHEDLARRLSLPRYTWLCRRKESWQRLFRSGKTMDNYQGSGTHRGALVQLMVHWHR